jgi:hypothetical protein
MKKIFYYVIILLATTFTVFSQTITVTPRNTILTDTLRSEMIFYIDVANISTAEQTVYIVRTINNLPSGWTSALCFDVCFSSELDSVITTQAYGSSPLQVGESREMSVHVVTDSIHTGQGNVQVKIGSTKDSTKFLVDITAIVEPTSVNNMFYKPEKFQLLQNYPNPFNPSTSITFDLPGREFVTVNIYNSIGQKIKTLVNQPLDYGRHKVDFNADGLTAGVYFYRIETDGFVSTKKMILLK